MLKIKTSYESSNSARNKENVVVVKRQKHKASNIMRFLLYNNLKRSSINRHENLDIEFIDDQLLKIFIEKIG